MRMEDDKEYTILFTMEETGCLSGRNSEQRGCDRDVRLLSSAQVKRTGPKNPDYLNRLREGLEKRAPQNSHDDCAAQEPETH